MTAEVYGWDLSVRGAHLDTTHGFFNGTCVFLRVLGREERECEVEILPPRGPPLLRAGAWRRRSRARAPGRSASATYAAADYDELIDHPVEMGTFALASFTARRRAARDRDHRPASTPTSTGSRAT